MQAHLRAIAVAVLLGSSLTTLGMGRVETDQKSTTDIRLMCGLGERLVSWLNKGDVNDAAECDRLINDLLKLEQPSMEAYFAAAQATNLRGRADQAISILESLIAKYPDRDAEVVHVPVRVLAPLWIATFAKQAGDMRRAVDAYERVLRSLDGIDQVMKDSLSVFCNLYIAEIDAVHSKAPAKALARLGSVDFGRLEGAQDRRASPFRFLKDWVAYQQQASAQDGPAAVPQWSDSESMGSSPFSGSILLTYAGMTGEPLSDFGGKGVIIFFHTMVKRSVEGGGSRIDASLAKLVCAYDYQGKRAVDKASEYYSALLEDSTFLSPVAGMYLHRIKVNQHKDEEAKELLTTLRVKYPGASRAWDEIEQEVKRNRGNQPQPSQ